MCMLFHRFSSEIWSSIYIILIIVNRYEFNVSLYYDSLTLKCQAQMTLECKK